MKKKKRFILKPPNIRFVIISIISGVPYENYDKWSKENKFGIISKDSYDALTIDLKRDEKSGEMIEYNQRCYLNGKKPEIIKSIREQFKYREIFDQLFLDLSSSFDKDPASWITPVALNYFLDSYQRRLFTECGLLNNTTFYELTKLWKKFNQVDLDLEYFHKYSYYFWDIRALTTPEIDHFINNNMIDCNYKFHREVVGGNLDKLKASYGMLSAEDRFHSIKDLAYKATGMIIDASGEVRMSLINLNKNCSSLVNKDLSKNERSKSIKTDVSYCKQGSTKDSLIAKRMRDKNREYVFSQVVKLITKMDGQNE